MSDHARRVAFLAIAPLAAGALGLLVMSRHGAGAAQLGLQAGALLAGALLALGIAAGGRDRLRAAAPWAAGVGLGLLVASLCGREVLGVHRWLAVGPVMVNASALACPAILAGAAALAARARERWAAALLLAAQAVHVLQPDAGQATALGAGGIALLAARGRPTAGRVGVGLALALGAALAWARPDPLPAVPIVEGIVGLAGARIGAGSALAALLLACIPITLALAARAAPGGDPFARPASAAVIAYLTGALLVPIFGNFPVPVMGFGASPILGFALAAGVVGAAASAHSKHLG